MLYPSILFLISIYFDQQISNISLQSPETPSAPFPPISRSKFSQFSSETYFLKTNIQILSDFSSTPFLLIFENFQKHKCLDFPSASFHPPRKANSHNFLIKYSLFWKQILRFVRFVTFFINNTCFLKQTHTFCISTIYLI